MSKEKTGVITAVSVQKNDASRCSVFVDGEFAFGCSMDIVLKYRLGKGVTLTPEILSAVSADESRMALRRQALTFATYKTRTREQVRRKMIEKGYSAEEAESAVVFLEEFNYLNDKEFARMFIADFLKRKPSGKQRLQQELRKRGISEDDAAEALGEFFPEENALDLARKAAEKKMRSLQWKTPDKRKSALISYLQRQGFSWEIIKVICSECGVNGKESSAE